MRSLAELFVKGKRVDMSQEKQNNRDMENVVEQGSTLYDILSGKLKRIVRDFIREVESCEFKSDA